MTRSFHLTWMALLAFLSTLSAQHQQCGTSHSDDLAIKNRMLDNRRQTSMLSTAFDASRSNNKVYIPVQFHIVQQNDGTGGESVQDALDNLCKLNQDFAFLEVEFFLAAPIRYIKQNLLYNITRNDPMANFYMGLYKQPDVMNIFIGNLITDPSDPTIVVNGFYSPSLDVIYMAQASVNGQALTLTHEVGHYFSLPHTFYGWDIGQLYDYNAVTINANGRTPSILPNGIAVERLERSGGEENCQIAGDGFCDTDANYLFGLYQGRYNSGPGFCEHSSAAVDPEGRLFRPDLVEDPIRFKLNEGNAALTELLTSNNFTGTYFPRRTLLVTKASFTPTGGTPVEMWQDTIGDSDSTAYTLGNNIVGAGNVKDGFLSFGDYYLDQVYSINTAGVIITAGPATYTVNQNTGVHTTAIASLLLNNTTNNTIPTGTIITIEEQLMNNTTVVSSESWTVTTNSPIPPLGTLTLPITDLFNQKSTLAGGTFMIEQYAPYQTVTLTTADNIMSYYSETCQSLFSTQQGDAMQSDIAARGLATLVPPPTDPVLTTAPAPAYPSSGLTISPASINFSWAAVSGAASYHLFVYQVDIFGNPFTNGERYDIISTNTSEILNLSPNTRYKWTVRALNQVSFCSMATMSTPVEFETDLGTNITTIENHALSLAIYPNPASETSKVTLNINSKKAEKASLRVLDALGRHVMPAHTLVLESGENVQTLDVASLSNGVYMIEIHTNQGRAVKRLLIHR